MNELIEERVRRRTELLRRVAESPGDVLRGLAVIEAALARGGQLLVFGNGGSATQASHLAAELVNKFYFQRRGLPAVALAADIANLTSIANDMDYASVFARQIEALGRPGDVALGVSTSGRSPNVLAGLAAAVRKGMDAVALCGPDGEPARAAGAHVTVCAPSNDTPTVQEVHLFILHFWAEMLEKNLCGGA